MNTRAVLPPNTVIFVSVCRMQTSGAVRSAGCLAKGSLAFALLVLGHAAPAPSALTALFDVRPTINQVVGDVLKTHATQFPTLQVLKTGSHVSGAGYRNPLLATIDQSITDVSDHDFELIAPYLSNPETTALYKTMRGEIQDKLIADLKGKLSPEELARVMQSVNFYPPKQLVENVQTQAEAVEFFGGLGEGPNLGGGPVEGNWGTGGLIENANYSARSGKLMTVGENGEVAEILADLTWRTESGAIGGAYTAGGCASTAGQWAQHGLEALHHEQPKSLLKYCQRMRTAYSKGCGLSRIEGGAGVAELDAAIAQLGGIFDAVVPLAKQEIGYDAQLAKIALLRGESAATARALLNAQLEAVKQRLANAQLGPVAAEIESVLTRTVARSALLSKLAQATDPGARAILSNLLNPTTSKWAALAESFWQNLPSLEKISDYAGEWSMVGITLYQVINGTPAEGMSAAAYDAIFRLGGWRAGIAGLATDLFLQLARDGLWGMAGRSQDALLLLNGIYTAWGAENVRESKWNMDAANLWKTFPDSTKGLEDLERLVKYHANAAATGKIGTTADREELEKRILGNCLPLIKTEWRRQRTEQLKRVNELFAQAMARVANGGATLTVPEAKNPAGPIVLAPLGPKGMEPVTVTLAVGFTYALPDVLAKLRQIREIVNALECNPGKNAFAYAVRVPLEVTGAGPVEKLGVWSGGTNQDSMGAVPDRFLNRARVANAGWYTARLGAEAELSVLTLAANSRDITDPYYCLLPSGRFAIPLLGEADFEVRAAGAPPATAPPPTLRPAEPAEKPPPNDRPSVAEKKLEQKPAAAIKLGDRPKEVARVEVPAGPVEMQGTFTDNFPAGTGGGPISLTFSDGLTRMKGSCDYKSTEMVSGGNRPGSYEFAGGKYPKLYIADGRFTGEIVCMKHYVLFPSAISNNSFEVDGTVDFQTGTITGRATKEPDYHWTVRFPPIGSKNSTATDRPPAPVTPTATVEKKERKDDAAYFGRNLVVNNGGEADRASPDGRDVVPINGWTVKGKVTLARYDSPNPDFAGIHQGSPVPPNGGNNFFTGGPDNASSSASQTIDLAAASATIDVGQAKYNFSGYLGGYGTDDDHTTLTAVFRNAQGASLGEVKLGPVMSKDRGGKDGLLKRETSSTVPSGTRSVILTLSMVRAAGKYNDGYADEIAFTLAKP